MEMDSGRKLELSMEVVQMYLPVDERVYLFQVDFEAIWYFLFLWQIVPIKINLRKDLLCIAENWIWLKFLDLPDNIPLMMISLPILITVNSIRSFTSLLI
ncbi:MAG: hypothetical protein NT178_16520 [Proteobacteria bacterium]|nr:hypothetical protein [Pseudomonadota bacterium]